MLKLKTKTHFTVKIRNLKNEGIVGNRQISAQVTKAYYKSLKGFEIEF